jgi:hypothetical protein
MNLMTLMFDPDKNGPLLSGPDNISN